MTEREPTIYEKMAQEKVRVACAQIRVLNHYEPAGEEQRLQKVYDVAHSAIMRDQSEKAIERMEEVIVEFQSEIKAYRASNPEAETSSTELRTKLRDLEEMLGSG